MRYRSSVRVRRIQTSRHLVMVLVATSFTLSAQQPLAAQSPPETSQAPRPPLPNRANELTPNWLRLRGEFRERVEGFDGLGFNDTRKDLYYLSRFRFGATVSPGKALSFQVQAQDARVARKTVGPTGTPFNAAFDLRMAFAEIGHTQSRAALRVGRQELVYGDQRLVGHVSWLNAARTFDGAKLSIRTNPVQLEMFATSVVRILDGAFDRSGNGNRFVGAHATASSLVPRASVEPYVFWRRDQNLTTETATRGTLRQTTVGVRWVGRLPANIEYNTETALQTGSLGSDDVRAWAGHYALRSPAAGRAAVRLSSEFNYASGDANPTDGRRGTFDQLYPTGHDKYGLADQVGWRNIRHARAGVEFTPAKGLPIGLHYHSWWLSQARDGLYNAGGTQIARVASGAASRHVAQEVDVQASRSITPQLQFAAGYAHIFTGAFLKQATPGASFSHPYIMATYVFLAER